MITDLSDLPTIAFTAADYQAIVGGHDALRARTAWLTVSLGDDEFPEKFHAYEPHRTPGPDGPRWSGYANAAGVWMEDYVTETLHGPGTMSEMMTMIGATMDADTAALIAAIPPLILPEPWTA